MNGEACNPAVNSRVAPLPAVGVAPMGPKRTDALDNGREPVQDLPCIVGNQRIEVAAVGVQSQWLAYRGKQPLDVFLLRQAEAELNQDRAANAFDGRACRRNRVLGVLVRAGKRPLDVPRDGIEVQDLSSV
jgi:hypothetical protein